MSRLYSGLSFMIRLFSHPMTEVWETPFCGKPSVFLCNHAGALGPIRMCAQFGLRQSCNPWLNADMMNPKAVPAYVRQDYWWKPGCALEPLYKVTLPYLAAAVLPPILKSAPGIPVYHDARGVQTFRLSLACLKEGRHLIIFPEQPSGYRSHHFWINDGFLQLAPMAQRILGVPLPFYPVYIDTKNRIFRVAAPVFYHPETPLREQAPRMLETIRKGIHP